MKLAAGLDMALSTLFGEDLAGRWKIISITATVVAVSGFATDWLTGSVPTAQLVSSSLGLLVFAALVLGYYTRRSHQASADNRDGEQSQLAFTGRRYWIFAIESATILAVADFISIIKRAGTQRVIDISLMVSAQAASALDDFANKKTPSADVKALAYLADSSVRFFQERKMPSTVVGAALTARAAFLVSEFPAVARNSDRNLALDLNGNVSRAAIHTGQDDFISNVRIFSSVANSHVDVVGILVDGEPNVVAFKVSIEGINQAIGKVFWIDCVFKRCNIRRGGGEINLVNVRFEDCRFDSSLEKEYTLKTLVIEAHGGPIIFSSET